MTYAEMTTLPGIPDFIQLCRDGLFEPTMDDINAETRRRNTLERKANSILNH